MAKLHDRFYIPEHLHPAMRFDIYTDGLVIMYVYGVETARKKVRGIPMRYEIYRIFAEELAAYGIGIAPLGEIREMREKIERVEEEVKRLKRRK